jgi:hypothetical protein
VRDATPEEGEERLDGAPSPDAVDVEEIRRKELSRRGRLAGERGAEGERAPR